MPGFPMRELLWVQTLATCSCLNREKLRMSLILYNTKMKSKYELNLKSTIYHNIFTQKLCVL